MTIRSSYSQNLLRFTNKIRYESSGKMELGKRHFSKPFSESFQHSLEQVRFILLLELGAMVKYLNDLIPV